MTDINKISDGNVNDLRDIYRRFKRIQKAKKNIEVELVACIKEYGYKVAFIEKTSIDENKFATILGFKMQIDEYTVFLPSRFEKTQKNEKSLKIFENFKKSKLIVPVYIQMLWVENYSNKLEIVFGTENQQTEIKSILELIHPVNTLAEFIIEYQKNKLISSFSHDIIGAICSYQMKFYRNAISSLIPCVEAIIRKLSNEIDYDISNKISKEIFFQVFNKIQLHIISRTIFKSYDWYPDYETSIKEFINSDERIQLIQNIKHFIENLYEDTRSDQISENELNRHGILHRIFNNFGNTENFLKLISFLNAILLLSVHLGCEGSVFHPVSSEESIKLSEKFLAIKPFI